MRYSAGYWLKKMKVKSVEFAHCVGLPEQLPPAHLPEVAMAGRSNVGKSSLINNLIQRRALARTSSQPGKTRTINYYLVNEQLYLVDLPGYGFAKVSKKEKEKWRKLLEGYLEQRQSLKGVLLIVDSRHAPAAADIQMYQWLTHYQRPLVVVATKLDKLRQRDITPNLKQIAQAYPEAPVIPFSAVKGAGREEIWKQIELLTAQQINDGSNGHE